MTDPAPRRFSFAKVVLVMAVCLLVGLGLCGLDFVLGAHGYGQPREEFGVGPIDGLSMVVMALSALGLVVSLIVWALSAIIWGISSSGKDKEPQKPLDNDDPPNHNNKA